ncbi:hypothetical protein [Streptomyces sp. NPDC048202]|uniref:hypothetical protein n=1 Tax=Streptomyces sp. NPDC048202 TaxID=3365514 RepID=UPI00370FC1F5
MTHTSTRAWLAVGAVTASVLLLASCSSDGGDGDATGPASSPAAGASSHGTADVRERKLTAEAQDVLAAASGGTRVEAGAERVTDGIHIEPLLREGKTYKLSLVCVGSGSARVTMTPASVGPSAEVPCDRSIVQQRITAPKQVRIDADGAKGSVGVIAWQIDTA